MTQQTAKVMAAADPGRRPHRSSRLTASRLSVSRLGESETGEAAVSGLTDMGTPQRRPAAFCQLRTKRKAAQFTPLHDAVSRPRVGSPAAATFWPPRSRLLV